MTKEQAQWLIDADLYPVEIGEALQALADGRTACVRVMSEDECRAEFEAWAVNNNMRNFSRREEDGEYCNGPAQAFWGVWLACARAMGAVADKSAKG